MLSARRKAIIKYKRNNNCNVEDGTILNKLVAYSSKLVKNCLIGK
jgi:hypothetical protein